MALALDPANLALAEPMVSVERDYAAQRPRTLNGERRMSKGLSLLYFGVRRSAFGVRRSLDLGVRSTPARPAARRAVAALVATAVTAALFASGCCHCRPSSRLSPQANGWQELFDGATLNGWRISDFAAGGEVTVRDGAIQIGMGYGCTGITYDGDVPCRSYEVELEGRRVSGSDFWCGLTFPVDDACLTLVLGGWGGSLVGLSCLDGKDASENETSQIIPFEDGRWYRVRVRVAEQHVMVWLDKRRIIDVSTAGRQLGIRPEVTASVPFGIATWDTHGAIRQVRIRAWPRRDPARESKDRD